jgi:NAD(P)-dependent dehydrogenase (short-subunit alcohol dehydrogenase family)
MVNDAGLGAVGASNYAAAGEGAIGFTRTLARDLGRYGVTANAISPLARTRLAAGYSEDLRPPAGVIDALTVARIGRPNPTAPWEDTGHPDDPESVAPLAVYLLSEANDNINAQVFGVRGGDIYLYSNPAIDRQIVSYGRRFTMEEMDHLMPRTLGLNIPRPVMA